MWPYSGDGYKKKDQLPCNRGCQKQSYYRDATCMKDDFGENELDALLQPTDKYDQEIDNICWEEYISYIRYKTELAFPVEMLQSLCIERQEQTPTGYGWFTIKIGRVVAAGEKGFY